MVTQSLVLNEDEEPQGTHTQYTLYTHHTTLHTLYTHALHVSHIVTQHICHSTLHFTHVMFVCLLTTTGTLVISREMGLFETIEVSIH